jgi:hypothetical protein
MPHPSKSGSPSLVTVKLALSNSKKENRGIMQLLSRRSIAAFGSIVILLASLEPARSQNDPQPSREPAIYKAQLREAVTLTRKNLREIQALSSDDSIPLPPQLLASAHSAYALIRAARHGMSLQRERNTTQDPMLELAFKRVDHAWDLARMPVDGRFMQRGHYISQATENLTQTIRLIDQALVILP